MIYRYPDYSTIRRERQEEKRNWGLYKCWLWGLSCWLIGRQKRGSCRRNVDSRHRSVEEAVQSCTRTLNTSKEKNITHHEIEKMRGATPPGCDIQVLWLYVAKKPSWATRYQSTVPSHYLHRLSWRFINPSSSGASLDLFTILKNAKVLTLNTSRSNITLFLLKR